MTRLQVIVVGVAVALFFTLYLGCETKTATQKKIDKSRALMAENIDTGTLIADTKGKLSAKDKSIIEILERQLASNNSDSIKINTLKELAGKWYDLEHPEISGIFAQQIAEITNTDESWSITGTTFAIAIKRIADKKIKDFSTNRAVQAFENAISLSPANISNRLNLALCYTDNPPSDNPMKGILMLRELNEEHPNDIGVINNLARLAIQTGQYGRAIERLTYSLSLDANNPNTNCLLADAYRGNNDEGNAKLFIELCKKLNSN